MQVKALILIIYLTDKFIFSITGAHAWIISTGVSLHWFKHILFITRHDKGSGRVKSCVQRSPLALGFRLGTCGPVDRAEDPRSEGLGFDCWSDSRPGALGKLHESHTLPLCIKVTIDYKSIRCTFRFRFRPIKTSTAIFIIDFNR